MTKRDIKDLIITLNSVSTPLFKYPIGNSVLMKQIKECEDKKLIKYNDCYSTWSLTKKGK